MTTPKLIDPKRPSRAYIADVLLSENVNPTRENIKICLKGWLLAVACPDRLTEARQQSMDDAFYQGDPHAIGFTTYVYGYAMYDDTPQQGKLL